MKLTKYEKLKHKLSKVYAEINELQAECDHPAEYYTKTACSSTGNYDPTQDIYWYDHKCTLCGKFWKTPQKGH